MQNKESADADDMSVVPVSGCTAGKKIVRMGKSLNTSQDYKPMQK